MANLGILAKTGLVISTNKENVKSILSKYNIDYGNGSVGNLIKSTFSAIKSGNKELATEIGALVQADKKIIGNNPLASSQSRKDLVNKIKTSILDKIKAVKNGKSAASNADGDTSEAASVADQLIQELSSKDIDTATSEGQKGAEGNSVSVICIVLLIALLLFIGYKIIKK